MTEKVIEKSPFDEFKKSLTAKGGRIWELLVESPAVIVERDFILMVTLVEAYEDYEDLKKAVKKRKSEEDTHRIATNPNGTIQSHPYMKQLKELRTEIKDLTREMGLSPMSAAKLKLLDNADAETIAGIMKPDR